LRAYFFVANQTSGQDIWNPCAKDKAELVNAEVPEKTANERCTNPEEQPRQRGNDLRFVTRRVSHLDWRLDLRES